jgi:hypothetical protein
MAKRHGAFEVSVWMGGQRGEQLDLICSAPAGYHVEQEIQHLIFELCCSLQVSCGGG